MNPAFFSVVVVNKSITKLSKLGNQKNNPVFLAIAILNCVLSCAGKGQNNLLCKANPNASDEEGRTGLHLACCNANSACVEILLSHGAKINCFDKQKLAAPLFCAVASGNGSESEAVVDLLLEAGVDINLGLHQLGVSALHVAVRANAVEHVRKLLKNGAIPNHVQLFR